MRRTSRTALVVAALLFMTVPGGSQTSQAAPPAQTTGTAAISGVVSDAVTGKPISGARVLLLSLDARPGAELSRPAVLTDSRGRFVVTDLPAGVRFDVAASHAGYNFGSITVKLTDGDWKRDANITMSRFGSISGRVVDERGEPVVGAAVRVFISQPFAGHDLLMHGAVASTDDRGEYRIPFLTPGRYLVGVLSVQATMPASAADGRRSLPLGGLIGPYGSDPALREPVANGPSIDTDGRHRLVLSNFATPPAPGGGQPRSYAPVFYPNGRTAADAQPVEIGVGTSRTAVDFQLAPVPVFTVSGRVSGAPGAANLLLRLMLPGSEHLGFGTEAATTVIEADGSFTLLNVPAGAYTLLALSTVAEMGAGSSTNRLPRGVGFFGMGLSSMYTAVSGGIMWWDSPAGADAWGRLQINVASDISGMDLPLHRTVRVRGRLVTDDPSIDLSRGLPVNLEPANADPLLGAPNTYTKPNDPSFEIKGLRDGRYLLRFPSFFGLRVESILVNGVELAETGFDGAAGADYDDVVVKLTKSGGQISGVVLDRAGAPAPGGVLLFPADSRLWKDYGLTPDRLRSTSVGADGAYKFTTLREGEYCLIAVPSVSSKSWLDQKFLNAAVSQAVRVSLSGTATKTQDLHMSELVVK